MVKPRVQLFVVVLFFFVTLSPLFGQENNQMDVTPPAKKTQPATPAKIEIKPSARDSEIQDRLLRILEATGWFGHVTVQVKEGVVFLGGEAKTEEFKTWAGDLAMNTQDVSAVVNQMDVQEPNIWNFQPACKELQAQWRDLVQILPSLAFALLIAVLTYFAAKLAGKIARKIFGERLASPLLVGLVAKTVGFFVFLIGLYTIFRVLGLTTIALTLVGGTGVLGIVLGIAFRDITENLLASILLSIHHPFRSGDLITIEGIAGCVQRLTIRSTVVIAYDGTQVQIPNATVYKSTIHNYSVNPNHRDHFYIPVDESQNIKDVQEIILSVLSDHTAVLDDPEPLVLIENLDKTIFNLKVYYWINNSEHSYEKVRSSLIRHIKREMQNANIQMPSDTHSLLFPSDLSVRMVQPEGAKKKEAPIEPKPEGVDAPSETDLSSEVSDINEIARQSRSPEKGEEDLLKGDDDESSS